MAVKPFRFYEHVTGLIGIATNVEKFRWGFGLCNAPVAESAFDRCKIKIYLEVKPDKAVFDGIDQAEYASHFRHFRASRRRSSVLYDQSVGRGVRLRFVMTIHNNTVRLVAGRSYMRLVRTKLMYIHPAAYILFDAVSLLLLKNGLTTLYCSAIRMKNGKTVVCMAPPNTGKSLCALKLKNDCGAQIIAEDMAVTDGRRIWGAAHTNLYRNYHDASLKAVDREQKTFEAACVDLVAVLQKGGGQSSEPLDNGLKRLMLLNHYSLGYYYSPCMRVFDYYYDGFSAAEAEKTEKQILEALLGGADCVLLKNDNPALFGEQIRGKLMI